MLDDISKGVAKFVMGGLGDIEDAFHTIKMENPRLSFPECADIFQREHNVSLNSAQINHGLKGYELAAKELGQA